LTGIQQTQEIAPSSWTSCLWNALLCPRNKRWTEGYLGCLDTLFTYLHNHQSLSMLTALISYGFYSAVWIPCPKLAYIWWKL